MHSKYSEVFSGRIEFLLSPDDMYQPVSQKARQELWRKAQEMLEHIRELEKQVEEQKEELERTRKQLDEYKKRHPEMVGVKNGRAYIASIDRRSGANGTGRKPGAQPGHQPHFRHVPAHIDGCAAPH